MPSSAYAIIADAIRNKRQVTCNYQGYPRELCPHTLGYTDGQERVLAFQFAGGSSKGLPPGGQWRCMNIDEMSNVNARNGEWHTGETHRKPQTCVKDVEFEVAY